MRHQHSSPISCHDLSLLHVAPTSSSTFTSCAFLSHWWMRNKAQMFRGCLLVLVTIDLMGWKRWHHNGIFKNPERVFHVLQHSLVQIRLSSLSWPFIPFGIMRRVLDMGDTSLNESPAHRTSLCEHRAVPCSRVFCQCSEGALAPVLLPEHFKDARTLYVCPSET